MKAATSLPNALATALLLTTTHIRAQQSPPATDPISTYLRRAFSAVAKDIVAGAEIMPEDGYTFRPDRPPRPARIVMPVDDSLTIGRGATSFTLYRVSRGHADPMLVAWFPSDGLLVESDLFGATSRPDRMDLKRFVLARGLPVRTIAGMHDTLATWQAFSVRVK